MTGVRSVVFSAFTFVLLLTAASFGTARAQKADPDKPGADRTVLLFDRLCYEMVPNFAGLEQRAGELKWPAITGAKLQQFRPAAEPKVLKAWSFTDLAKDFSIAISQSDMDAQGKADFPDFATAQVYSCSLIMPAQSPRAEVSAAMEALMTRKPDETSEQGNLAIETWTGQDATRLVIINHMGAKSGGPGGLLSVTLMLKK